MSDDFSSAAVVEQHIRQAFADVPYPGDKNLIREDGMEDPWAEEVIARLFVGKPWQDITYGMIRELSDEFVFFSIDAFLYYLPAYLIAYLNWNPDDALGDSLLNSLGRPHPKRWNDLINYDAMTPEQCEAVKLFLQYILHVFPDSLVSELEVEDSVIFWAELRTNLEGLQNTHQR